MLIELELGDDDEAGWCAAADWVGVMEEKSVPWIESLDMLSDALIMSKSDRTSVSFGSEFVEPTAHHLAKKFVLTCFDCVQVAAEHAEYLHGDMLAQKPADWSCRQRRWVKRRMDHLLEVDIVGLSAAMQIEQAHARHWLLAQHNNDQ